MGNYTSDVEEPQSQTSRNDSGLQVGRLPETGGKCLTVCTVATGDEPGLIDLIHGHKLGQDSNPNENTGKTYEFESIDLDARESSFQAEQSRLFESMQDNLSKCLDVRQSDAKLNRLVAAVLDARDCPEDAQKLCTCGSYLLFRAWLLTGNVRLREAIFCKLNRACQGCGRIRAAMIADVYAGKTLELLRRSREPGERSLVPAMVTVTVPPASSYADQLACLLGGLKSIHELRRNSRKAGRKFSEWANITHLAMSVESKRSSSSPENWHLHAHGMALIPQALNLDKIQEDWSAITGAKHRPDVRLLSSGKTLLKSPRAFESEAFRAMLWKDSKEVFKYSTKFGGMVPEDIAEAHLNSRRRRLLFGWDGYHGCKVPEDLSDLGTDAGPWFDYHFGNRDAEQRARLLRIRQGDESNVGPWEFMGKES